MTKLQRDKKNPKSKYWRTKADKEITRLTKGRPCIICTISKGDGMKHCKIVAHPVQVCGKYINGGDQHWLEGEWLGVINDGTMTIAITQKSSYSEFFEEWIPDGEIQGRVLNVPIENIRFIAETE